MTKLQIEQMSKYIQEIVDGKPGIVLIVNEEMVADYGNPIDLELLVKGLEIYGEKIHEEGIVNILEA